LLTASFTSFELDGQFNFYHIMSTTPLSNHSTHNQLSVTHSAFKDQVIEDPYLSAASDLEDFGIGPENEKISPALSTDRLTGDERNQYQLNASNLHDLALADPDFLNSLHTSPSADDILSFDGMELDTQPASNSNEQPTTSLQKDASSIQSHLETYSQLLSPDLTNNPSPASEFASTLQSSDAVQNKMPRDWPTRLAIPERRHGIVSLSPTSGTENRPIDHTSTSPVVKVSSYSRGDSPVRDGKPAIRRESNSSNLLSPTCGSDAADQFEADHGNADHSMPDVSALRSEDGSWIPNPVTGQAGIDPSSRADLYIASPQEMEDRRRLSDKNADIQSWSVSVSVADPYQALRSRPSRRRARSVGDPSGQDYFNFDNRGSLYPDDSNIPGPGVLIDEASEESDSGSEPESTDARGESPVATAQDRMGSPKETSLPADSEQAADDGHPLPTQFIRPYPWRDYPRFPDPIETRMQPATSRDAIGRFWKQAKNIETASRSATWGTKKLTDSEVDSLLESGTFLKSLSISKAKTEARSGLFRLLPSRSSSNSKRKVSQTRQSSFDSGGHDPRDHKNESSPISKPQPKLPFGRPKSPSLGTGSTVAAAIAGQVAASIGGHGSFQATSPTASLGPSPSLPRRIRTRSKSEIPPSLKLRWMDLMTRRGGPADVTTSSPPNPPPAAERPPHGREGADEAHDDVEDEDELMYEKGVVMDFPVPSQSIIPTLEGFKTQIMQLNPRLEPALLHRFANEQVRRHKKLVQDKNKHTQAVSHGSCTAGEWCFLSGGRAKLLPPRPSARDPNGASCLFHIQGHEGIDDEPKPSIESPVAPAVFPLGVPLPPVKRLPAEFECPLCFKVKQFQKPSDWTKHVHEDIQPFTCTFPGCTEPKSFKRKADWVRHESERHRQLEWWTCNMPECVHQCFRKDNFVQHLVREHKRPEPKVKKAKEENPLQDEAIQQLWRQVDECHHVSSKQPQDEPCRFCGNICNDWKKLTVHLARHLEQMALPILKLVADIPSPANQTSPLPKGRSHIGPTARSDVITTASADVKVEPPFDVSVARVPCYSERSGQGPGLNISQVPAQLPGQGGLSLGPSGAVGSRYPEADSFLNPLYTPVHRNSVSYPPPYNAMPSRPAAVQDNSLPAANSFGLTVSTLGANAVYTPQGELYASPTTDNLYLYPDGITLPYHNSREMGYPTVVPAQEDGLSPTASYIPHPPSSPYQFQ
jgi:hypothetical protein